MVLPLELETTMARFRRFTENDWNGYNGAEKLPDGTPPLIYESEDGRTVYLICGNGPEDTRYHLTAQLISDPAPEADWDEPTDLWYTREVETKDLAKRIGFLLPENSDDLTMYALGFRDA